MNQPSDEPNFCYVRPFSNDYPLDTTGNLFNWLMLGSLIKLVYFSRHEDKPVEDKRRRSLKQRFCISNGNRRSYPILGGRLHFVKFETSKISDCLDFIKSKNLHRGGIISSYATHSYLGDPYLEKSIKEIAYMLVNDILYIIEILHRAVAE